MLQPLGSRCSTMAAAPFAATPSRRGARAAWYRAGRQGYQRPDESHELLPVEAEPRCLIVPGAGQRLEAAGQRGARTPTAKATSLAVSRPCS